ncbi:MAG: hypothetical protein KY476_12605 [Planctomycetes bacterium]|nr:hypothetical protein [Planctomycetota bacterium]
MALPADAWLVAARACWWWQVWNADDLPADAWLVAARAADPPEVDGTWQVTRFDAATGHCFDGFRLILESDGMALRGRILWPSGKESPLAAGEIKQGRISFRATPGSMIQQYSGELRGEGIHGKWAVGIATFDWTARRVPADAPADDAAGNAFHEVEHEFVGVSDERSYDAALTDALRKMDKAVAEKARFPCSKTPGESWRSAAPAAPLPA